MFFMNPLIMFRLKSDGSASLFNPDNNETLLLNRTTTVIYKLLFEGQEREDILNRLSKKKEPPAETGELFDRFIEQLRAKGCIGLPVKKGCGF